MKMFQNSARMHRKRWGIKKIEIDKKINFSVFKIQTELQKDIASNNRLRWEMEFV